MITIASSLTSFTYQNIVKPLLFQVDPELVHELMTDMGEFCGSYEPVRSVFSYTYAFTHPSLTQKLHGIQFTNPVGLAAGFDYRAQLTQILPAVGFGFGTLGTITRFSYEGNQKPRLGRLPKSKSLLVNKGFKNAGAAAVIKKLMRLKFRHPVGVSIGRTNSQLLTTQKQSITDIVKAFSLFENSHVKHAYYELNISCPNLRGNITFYPAKNLHELLSEIDRLKISRPLFIKMPISETNRETQNMLEVIVTHKISGVIFGNLQKNRRDKSVVAAEVAHISHLKGHLSGKPTWHRSNELIKLAYKNYGKQLTVIGCGGIFSAEDAYTKIKLGASLVQLITGMVYQGPALIGQINYGLTKLLQQDGLQYVAEAVGVES